MKLRRVVLGLTTAVALLLGGIPASAAPRGYNWGQWGTVGPQDPGDNVAAGANSVRIPLFVDSDHGQGAGGRTTSGPIPR